MTTPTVNQAFQTMGERTALYHTLLDLLEARPDLVQDDTIGPVVSRLGELTPPEKRVPRRVLNP